MVVGDIMRILVTAGGTGGHIYPALAIIEKFKEKDPATEVLYIGTHNRMEKDIVPKRNIKYIGIEIYGLNKNIWHDLKNINLIRKDIKKCQQIIKEFKPDVVIGVGGYVTYPVLVAAHKLNIPIFIHEQNALPGKSNRLLSKYANLIGVSFLESSKYFPQNKVVYTGNPTGIMALNSSKKKKNSLGFTNKPLVVIVAGSLGSVTINMKMQDFLKNMVNKDYQVLYITGKNYYDEFIKEKYPSNVKIVPYLDNLAGLLKNTDCLVTRAGASTIAEIIALRLPSIFIPSPYVANNHQYYNALNLEKENAAYIIEEKDLTALKLEEMINKVFTNKEILQNNLKKYKVMNSSEIIYQEIKKILKKE